MIGNFPAVLNFNRLFINSTGSSVSNCRFSRIIAGIMFSIRRILTLVKRMYTGPLSLRREKRPREDIRATSHTRLRAHYHYTSSTPIGGEGGAGPSSLGTNEVHECKMGVRSTWIPTWHQMDHVSWSLGLLL